MKYSITRKINLGKYGLQYEALDIGVSDANTWEEAETEIREQLVKIDTMYREAKAKSMVKAKIEKDLNNLSPKELVSEPFEGNEFNKKSK